LDVGVRAYRILYRSRGYAGDSVAVSGVVLLPAGPRPTDGWPVIAYGHGSSGYAGLCAPSLMADLYHGAQLTSLLRRGYAVVMSDYAGLGGPGRHQVMSKITQAYNILDALTAARTLVPALSRRWIAYGHSQGGTAVLGVAELMRDRDDEGFLGTVATAPPSQLPEMIANLTQNPYASGFIPLLAAGVRATYPKFAIGDVLTDAAAQRYPVVESNCLNSALAAYADLTGDALVQPGFLNNTWFARYLKAGEPTGRVSGPVLLLQGGADSLVLPSYSATLASTLTSNGAAVDYRVYPDLAHDTYPGVATGIDDGAMADILTWIDSRFASRH
jgi:alpha-beta hydrolase superfamily lysophospholipase